MDKSIALASPPEGFTLDPVAVGDIPKEDQLRAPCASAPIVIGISLDDVLMDGVAKRVLQAKGGLEQRFNPPKTSA